MGEKYPVLRPREVIAVLEKIGFQYKSQKGSHVKYSNASRMVVIPMHDTVARGTLRSILMQADIDLDSFMKLL